MRPVRVVACSVLGGDGPGMIADFRPRERLPDRKHAKLMSRGVQLGVAVIGEVLRSDPEWEDTPPERRGIFVGTSPGGGEPEELEPALQESSLGGSFELSAFGQRGFPLVPPLWLVRGLTNNIVGFSSAYHDIRGPNTTHAEGGLAGMRALLDGIRAIAEGKADRVVAGGADSLIHAEGWWPNPVGEGAAFFVLAPGEGRTLRGETSFCSEEPDLTEAFSIGAGVGPVAVARAFFAGGGRVELADRTGAFAWMEAT